jgi:translation initiation factor 3 subunit M
LDEVETWVVHAITVGLIDARMDQLSKTVTVTRSVKREFTTTQWKELKDRLDGWANNISSMLKSIEARTA